MRMHAIINRRAGAALGLDAEEFTKLIRDEFQRQGLDVLLDFAEPKTIEKSFANAMASNPDVLVAGGGDGTVRCAARHVLNTSTALSIIPLGTVNRLARDLHIPLEPREAIGALATSARRKIDAAEVNGHIFLCNSLLGIPPEISEERQTLRGRPMTERLSGYFKLMGTIISSHHRIDLVIGEGQSKRHVRALSVAVSNNTYSHEPTLVFKRETLDGGRLGIYISRHRSGLGLVWVLARAALGQWSGDRRLDSIAAPSLTISSTHAGSFRLSNDGEVEELAVPLRYKSLPGALTVFAPPLGTP